MFDRALGRGLPLRAAVKGALGGGSMARTSKAVGGISLPGVVVLLAFFWMLGKCSSEPAKIERTPPASARIATQPPPAANLTEQPAPNPILYVDADSLNYRTSPDGAIVGRLSRGTRIAALERKDGWIKISVGGSGTAWIAERHTCASASCWVRTHAVASSPPARQTSAPSRAIRPSFDAGCPCSSSANCYGPRGGRYCITSGGNKRYR